MLRGPARVISRTGPRQHRPFPSFGGDKIAAYTCIAGLLTVRNGWKADLKRHSNEPNCRGVGRMKWVAVIFLLLASCSGAAIPPLPNAALRALQLEKKFQPDSFYTGVDTPEDQQPLESAVEETIKDVSALPEPRDRAVVRERLSKLMKDTDLFATEDRDQVYRYIVRMWRACGFKEETHLFGVSDDRVLARP